MAKYRKLGWKGVYSIDQLDQIPVSKKMAFILNLDPSYKPGSHWVAVYIDAQHDKEINYYDSFGDEPPKRLLKDIKVIVDKLNPNVYLKFKVNKVKHQSVKSSNCGFFAMKFIIERLSGEPFKNCSGFSDAIRGERNIEKFKKKLGFGYI